MERRYVPLRRLGDVTMRRRLVFHLRLVWYVVKMYWWDVVVTSSWDVLTTFQEDAVETYHWDVFATLHQDVVGCFIWDVPATSLGCREWRRYNVATTSCCRVGSFPWKTSHESSAYRNRFDLTACGMSFTYVRNSNGSGMGPCGTPHVILEGYE